MSTLEVPLHIFLPDLDTAARTEETFSVLLRVAGDLAVGVVATGEVVRVLASLLLDWSPDASNLNRDLFGRCSFDTCGLHMVAKSDSV